MTKGSISVSAACHARLATAARERGTTMAALVEQLLADVTGSTPPPPRKRRQSRHVELDVGTGVYELVHDHVVRQREIHGVELSMSAALDAALERMLDALESGRLRWEPEAELPPARPVERSYEPTGALTTIREGIAACRTLAKDPRYRRLADLDEEHSRTPFRGTGATLPDRKVRR